MLRSYTLLTRSEITPWKILKTIIDRDGLIYREMQATVPLVAEPELLAAAISWLLSGAIADKHTYKVAPPCMW